MDLFSYICRQPAAADVYLESPQRAFDAEVFVELSTRLVVCEGPFPVVDDSIELLLLSMVLHYHLILLSLLQIGSLLPVALLLLMLSKLSPNYVLQ